MAAERTRNLKRIGLQVAFWAVLGILLLTVLQNFINISQSEQLSAYDDDWNDMSAFREDINDMGIETRSLVSSPLLLADLEDPRNTTFVVAGVERDTLSFPQFDEDGFITIATEDGYSPSEVDAIVEFVDNGGTVIVLEDFGYAGSIGEAYGVRYSGYQLYDTNYVAELDYNYIWMCMQASPCGMNGTTLDPTTIDQHERWSDVTGPHPCSELDGQAMTLDEAGICSHHWVKSSGEQGRIEYNATYTMLLNNVTGLEIVPGVKGALNDVNVRAVTSNQATVDVNGDGALLIGNEQSSRTPDLSGQFNLSIEACASSSCDPDEGGRVFFIADGSSLINAIYDYEGFNNGEYGDKNGDFVGKPTKTIPANDNRKWALDVISESLMSTKDGETGQPAENAMVIFDESRHPQNALLADSYNTVYFLLVYFTGEGLAMLALFVVLFITFEGVLLKKRDPEPWRHIFSIIYYGFGDANRYTYYAKTEKIRQVFLSKVRNQNGLTRDEFHAMSAKELVGLIEDPVLAKFAIEPGKYSLEQSVALVKRIKAWGRR